METQTQTRQSQGKNIADFIAGAGAGLRMLPTDFCWSALDLVNDVILSAEENDKFDKERAVARETFFVGRSQSYKTGYALASIGPILIGSGYLICKHIVSQ